MSNFYCRNQINIKQVEQGQVKGVKNRCEVQCKRCSLLEKSKLSKQLLDENNN